MTEAKTFVSGRFPLLSVGPTKFKQVTAETATPPYTFTRSEIIGIR